MVPTLFGNKEELIQQGKELFFTRLGVDTVPWQNAKDWVLFLHRQTKIDPRIALWLIRLMTDVLMEREKLGLENAYLLVMAFPEEFQAYSALRKLKSNYMDDKRKRISQFISTLTEKQLHESYAYRNSFTAVRVLSK